MLHRVHIHAAFGDGGGSLDLLHLLGQRWNEGLVLQVHAAEFEAKILGGRLKRERDLLAGMKRGAGHRDGFGEGVLTVGEGHGREWKRAR